MVDPAGRSLEVRDVVLACGERRFVELEPGEEITGQIQLLYTSAGFTFDQAGTYTLRAELDPGEEPGTLLRSAPAQLVIRPAASEDDLRLEALATQDAVGLAFALGDPSADSAADAPLSTLVEEFADTGVARVAEPELRGEAFDGRALGSRGDRCPTTRRDGSLAWTSGCAGSGAGLVRS